MTKLKTSENDVFDKVSNHRYSDQNKPTLIKTPNIDLSSTNVLKKRQIPKFNPLTQTEFFVNDDYHQETDKFNQNLVLNIDGEQ